MPHFLSELSTEDLKRLLALGNSILASRLHGSPWDSEEGGEYKRVLNFGRGTKSEFLHSIHEAGHSFLYYDFPYGIPRFRVDSNTEDFEIVLLVGTHKEVEARAKQKGYKHFNISQAFIAACCLRKLLTDPDIEGSLGVTRVCFLPSRFVRNDIKMGFWLVSLPNNSALVFSPVRSFVDAGEKDAFVYLVPE